MKKEILFFSAPWCGPCKQMKNMIDESVKKELNIKYIDISKDVDLATQHKIMNVPTFVVIEEGVEKTRKIGATTIDGLRVL